MLDACHLGAYVKANNLVRIESFGRNTLRDLQKRSVSLCYR